MVDVSIARTAQERVALALLKAMEDGTLMGALPQLTSEEFEWANSGLPTVRGRQNVIDFLASGGFRKQVPILNAMTHFSADVLHLASNGGIVFTERVDHHWDKDGRDLMTPHIAGVMEVVDGRVTSLRDYYDVACYQQKPTAPNRAFADAP